jgi:carboxymethylenebutenolidase
MVSTSTVTLSGLTGHMALPDKGKGKGVLLVHAWWGLNEFFKTLADRLAAEGFVVFAPDYYNGKVARTVDEATKFSGEFDRKEAATILKRAVKHLKQHPSITGEKIGVIGVSLGTRFSVNLARELPKDIGAVVLSYGITGGKFDRFVVPLQGHFAEHDGWGSEPKDVERFETRLAESKKEYELHIYEGTTHWFLEEDVVGAYDERAAALAFKRTAAFLKANL